MSPVVPQFAGGEEEGKGEWAEEEGEGNFAVSPQRSFLKVGAYDDCHY